MDKLNLTCLGFNKVLGSLKDRGLSMTEFKVLIALQPNGEVTRKELAQLMNVHCVDSLTMNNLVSSHKIDKVKVSDNKFNGVNQYVYTITGEGRIYLKQALREITG